MEDLFNADPFASKTPLKKASKTSLAKQTPPKNATPLKKASETPLAKQTPPKNAEVVSQSSSVAAFGCGVDDAFGGGQQLLV